MTPGILRSSILLAGSVWLVTTAGCNSAPQPVKDPEIEAQQREKEADNALLEARKQDVKRVINDMDKWIDAYVTALLNSGATTADSQAEKIEKHIRSWIGPPEHVYFHDFMRYAEQRQYPRNRAIALAALGFSARREALDPLLNALGDDNVEIVSNAVLGLAILKDPRTPPSYLARVIENKDFESVMRGSAAWALYRIQTDSTNVEAFVKVWIDLLSVPLQDAIPEVAVSALRGLGQARDPAHATIAERYVSHPTPLVRNAAAVALGRMGNQASYEALIALIGPAESVPNVRLAAHKALQMLAGGVDLGYDVDEWRAMFERG